MAESRFDESYGADPAENYERFFTPWIGEPLAQTLLKRAAVQPTERVLDVACGTGILSRLLAHGMVPTGGLAGLDPNPGMLAVARRAAPASTKIEWYEAPAEEMPLPAESFDVGTAVPVAVCPQHAALRWRISDGWLGPGCV